MPPYYPHMMPEDIPVWERWLALHDSPELMYTYDVKVGESITSPQDTPEPWATMAYTLSKKRIDVVITAPTKITIVEVKKLAGWTALGQMLGYPVLFDNEFQPEMPVDSLLIAEALTLDTKTILDFHKIPYELV